MAATLGTTTYAGFWRRFVAWFLDGLLLSLVTLPITLQFGATPPQKPHEPPRPAPSPPWSGGSITR